MRRSPLQSRAQRVLKNDLEEQRLFRRRAWIGFIGIVVLVALLASRYAWLQLWEHDDFSTASESNRVQVRPVPPNRGMIYDRRGRVLATNRPAFRLEVIPEKSGDLEDTLARLAEVVTLTDEDLERFEQTRRRYRDFHSVPLRLDLDEGEVSRFAVNRHRFEGVAVVPYLSRYYPYGDLLTHVLGYVGRVDERDLARVDTDNYRGTTHIGKLGVERAYEDELHGRRGLERVETNARGRTLRVLEREEPLDGSDVILSIDVDVQRAAWEALGDRAGSVVAIDPRDGAVIAMVSKPSFDPNLFVNGIRQAEYQGILDQPRRPLVNRSLNGGYEPGSTLKPFVGIAGLEAGVVTPDTQVFSNGRYYLPNYDRPYRDWKDGGHGMVDITRALEESVNSYFYQLAYDLGIDRMHDTLSRFGFGAATGIDLPGESAGLLPSRDWKRGRYSEPWYPGETVIAGIGQGFNVTTPLQLANAQAALVNGGRVFEPRVAYAIKGPEDPSARRVEAPLRREIGLSSPEYWDVVHRGMWRVVNGSRGTARDVALEAGYVIAGKTGTAQVFTQDQSRDYDQEELAEELRNHALFIAYAPYEAPTISIAVVVDHGGAGSTVAAPIARATLDAWLGQESRLGQLR
ncbi:MAG: penicillin-binding protein 2 [Xanthomonadales bacterium]|jgi:penicillin-binding protein 2|nr:penicillin-binding protein 2 [Xanthomonadales bacterium]